MVTHLTMWNGMLRCNNGAMQQWCNAQRPQCQYGYVAPQQYAGGV